MRKRNVSTERILLTICKLESLFPEPLCTVLPTDKSPKSLAERMAEQWERASFDEIIKTINDYSSFFNYCLVEQLIIHLGTEEDNKKLVEYKAEFFKYAQRSIYHCPQLGIAKIGDTLPVIVKVENAGFERCYISQLQKFVNELAITLGILIGTLILQSVIPGCIQLTLAVPEFIHKAIFPLTKQQEEALAARGVIKVSTKGYQYPRDPQDEDGDDGDYGDDKPDDGPPGSDSGKGTTITSDQQTSKHDDQTHRDDDTSSCLDEFLSVSDITEVSKFN